MALSVVSHGGERSFNSLSKGMETMRGTEDGACVSWEKLAGVAFSKAKPCSKSEWVFMRARVARFDLCLSLVHVDTA